MSSYAGLDLVSLIEQVSGIRLTRKASTGGGEWAGMCPLCKTGTDRFLVWPNDPSYPHWYCRVCGKRGGAAWFLVEYLGLSYPEACQELGIELDGGYGASRRAEPDDRDAPPSKQWQETGKIFVERAERALWHTTEGRFMLAYLYGRGLCDETIRRAHLGYCPVDRSTGKWYEVSFEDWGIDPNSIQDEKKRERGTVMIPPGIVIPWFEGECLWKIALKRPGQPKPGDYGQVLGSKEGMYNISAIQYDQPAMMVESEICALSVQQEAGDIINVVATGSVSRGRRERWVADLLLASFVLQAFDNDEPDEQGKRAGNDGAKYWEKRLPKVLRWTPWKKDVNDMLRASQDVRQWVIDGIDAYHVMAQASLPEAAASPSVLPQETPSMAAHRFYESFCSAPGHHLRLREDGRIGIGVPESMSDADYERIVDQVCACGHALLHVLSEREEQAA